MWKLVVAVLAALLAVGFGSLTGGFTDIEKNDSGAIEALSVAVNDHNRKSNSIFVNRVAEVIRVQRQVVAGLKYKITVRMESTDCRKDSDQECIPNPASPPSRSYHCTFEVWTRLWLKEIKVAKEQCETDNF